MDLLVLYLHERIPVLGCLHCVPFFRGLRKLGMQ